jgi:preprotein translocase subunit SecG
MTGVLLGSVLGTLFALLLILVSLFLILLVLVQRGRGGGLTGALGGMGGQSAFGTKAGDTFTRVTIGAATVWIVLSLFAVKLLSTGEDGLLGNADRAIAPGASTTTPADPAPEDTATSTSTSTSTSSTSTPDSSGDSTPSPGEPAP